MDVVYYQQLVGSSVEVVHHHENLVRALGAMMVGILLTDRQRSARGYWSFYVLCVLLSFAVGCSETSSQDGATAQFQQDEDLDRNAVPDFSGVWSNASLTRLTRAENVESLVLDPALAQSLTDSNFHNVRAAKAAQQSDPDRGAPEKLDRLPPVGNYSANWVDPGARYAVVNGEIRSSWITDPENGQMPFSEAAQEVFEQRRVLRAAMSGPEVLSPGERCLIGFGGSGGPPMLNVLYNNFYRIMQTPTHLMILVEMVHDTRIIPIGAGEPVAGDLRWLGNSSAEFDGDTLVITTSQFHPARATSGPVPLSKDAVVTERLRLASSESLYYAFEISDPQLYTETVRGEMSFQRSDQRVFEYACHEGNYAMGSMLRGARLLEMEAVSDQ
jgi:hypothetical protein